MKRVLLSLIVSALMLPVLVSAADDAEIRSLLDNRINTAKKAAGVVVGVLDEKGQTKVIGAGRKSMEQDLGVPDGDTVFEIGSITKVFTAILLADMVLKNEVKLDDRLAKYLPEGVQVPSFEGREITLIDLSTQTSALPSLPNNFRPADMTNPYADYKVEQLYEFLGKYQLKRAPGEKYEYSNMGVGLLGQALARRAGMSYEALVTERILKPLKMTRSSIELSEAQKANFAFGHTAKLAVTKNWDLPVFAGAGALRSTVNDMLKFMAANLGTTETPLKKAMEMTHATQKPTGVADLDIGMNWHVFRKFQTDVVWHNGGTGGYRTWAGFVKAKKQAVVVLCNTSFGVDDLGLHFLVADYPAPMMEPPVERKEITLDAAVLKRHVGVYPLAPQMTIAVTEEGGKLYAQPTDQPRFRLYAESETGFFLKEVEAQVTFEKNEAGDTVALVLTQGGAKQRAARKAVDSK